jgi:hypothetical protein
MALWIKQLDPSKIDLLFELIKLIHNNQIKTADLNRAVDLAKFACQVNSDKKKSRAKAKQDTRRRRQP